MFAPTQGLWWQCTDCWLPLFSHTIQMSDVEAGGATVFPQINLALWPKKGAAAFWHNLHPSGEGDELTRHAACPVLVGTKWGKDITAQVQYYLVLMYLAT